MKTQKRIVITYEMLLTLALDTFIFSAIVIFSPILLLSLKLLIFQKAQRRKNSLQNHVAESLFDSKTKERLFSSAGTRLSEEEEEDENGQRFFVLHKPNFRLKKFEKLTKTIDDAYMGKSSRKSLEQMRRREIGELSNRSPPKLKFGSHLFLKSVNE